MSTDFQKTCLNAFYLLVQLITPIALIYVIIFNNNDNNVEMFLLILCFHFVCQLFHPLCSFLWNINNCDSMYETMQKVFTSIPSIVLHCECYHYRTREEQTKNEKGETVTKTIKEKEVSSTHSKEFKYYSVLDTSGIFKLNFDGAIANEKKFIKLYLDYELSFADVQTEQDYAYFKRKFEKKYKHLDEYIEIWEKRNLPYLVSNNLVKISVSEQIPYVNIFWYLLLSIIPATHFYRNYVDSMCVEQSFTVKKVISSRFNLINNEQYYMYIPGLQINQSKYNYNNYGNCFEENLNNLPTLEELEIEERNKPRVNVEQMSPMQNKGNYQYNMPMSGQKGMDGRFGYNQEGNMNEAPSCQSEMNYGFQQGGNGSGYYNKSFYG